MRQKQPPRVVGPYKEKDRWRLVIFDEMGRRSEYFDSVAEAQRKRRILTQKLARVTRRLDDMVEQYTRHKIDNGQSLPKTATDQRQRLLDFFGPYVERDITTVTSERAAALYETAVTRIRRKTGQPLAAASHRAYLDYAKAFFSWAVEQRFLPQSPFQEVRPRGKPNRGKLQLRIDEADRFIDAALLRWHEAGTPLSIAALMALYMGLRASEILRRRVRDLDAGGRILWVDFGKTDRARRHLKVPAPLRPILRQLCQGKSSQDFLFGSAEPGKSQWRQSLWNEVRRICKLAQVPIICIHSLRGLYATLAVESGAVSDAVAASLGHGSFAITERHYAAPASVHNAKTARVALLLDGRPASMDPEDEGEGEADEEDLLRRMQKLDRVTIRRLLEQAEAVGSRKPN